MIGEISALGCAVCWALSSTLTKSLAGKFEPRSLNLLRCLAASLVFWGLIPFVPGIQGLMQVSGANFLYLMLSALVGIVVGDTIYLRALRLINVTVAFPIAQSTMPVLTIVAAVLFLDEPMSWTLGVGTALILLGVYLIAAPERGFGVPIPSSGQGKKGMGIALMLIASTLWAVSISFLKLGLQGTNLILANGLRLPAASLALGLFLLVQNPRPQPTRPRFSEWTLGAATGILSFGLGGILFLLSIRYAGAGKAAVLTSSGPLFGLPLSVIFLRERVTVRIVLGTILGVAGIGIIV